GACHLNLWPRHHADRAGSHRGRDEILAVEGGALECTEDRSGRHFPMVDREAGHRLLAVTARVHAYRPRQARKLHSSSPTSGFSCVRTTSRVSSGSTPSSGPIRGTSRPTMGAAFHAAVRWYELAMVPFGSSSMAMTT